MITTNEIQCEHHFWPNPSQTTAAGLINNNTQRKASGTT